MATPLDAEIAAALVGAAGEVRHHVTGADTAATLGSGDLPVLGTPRMIALMEEAACRALLGRIPPQFTTVGVHLDIRHDRPTPVGHDVVARAEVIAVDRSRVTYAVRAVQGGVGDPVEIGSGTHVRAIVDRESFLGLL
jgi:fluoroacetyl-CoA thioesterase